MPTMPASGSKTSPVPVSTSDTSLSATIIIASSRRKKRSVRQSLASSTAARVNCPGYCSSFDSSRSNKVKASAVAPAKPPMTSPLPSRRTFLALALTMVWPIETWPSPPTATSPPLRTVRMVVPCHRPAWPASKDDMGPENLLMRGDLGVGRGQCKSRDASGGSDQALIQGARLLGKERNAQGVRKAQDQGNRRRGRDRSRRLRWVVD